ncbi:hypothetical protein BTA51_00290 [Hahella sp. CCB-MM4]|uniref:hypothetical protein n=1 Tax=Hahella sp. (strain CCB-MM4) TaxID=1926491 RepID=UPI000B9BB19A|nr:hypothetical protein [Hahella sp. CCB-MM4]OZG74884.1 hypothetical protein BTA51_00290 [Hahella sp. CCB-MM4]
METPDEFQSHTIILFTDDENVAQHVEESMAAFSLNHDLRVCQSVMNLAEPSTMKALRQIDLFLIAYLGDDEQARQTLIDLQSVRRWKVVPTIVFLLPEQIELAHLFYSLGANSVLPYPLHFEQLSTMVSIMDTYWFDIVSLPSDTKSK